MKKLGIAINEAIDLSLLGIESTIVWFDNQYHVFPYKAEKYKGIEIIKHFK
tara:strand:+ start:513 stop:665 length:153 start_codon:yes stop_codon:yes gene_type:complete